MGGKNGSGIPVDVALHDIKACVWVELVKRLQKATKRLGKHMDADALIGKACFPTFPVQGQKCCVSAKDIKILKII